MDDLRQRIHEEMIRPVVVGFRWGLRVFLVYLTCLLPLYGMTPHPGRGLRILATGATLVVLAFCHHRLGRPGLLTGQIQVVTGLGMVAVLGQILTNLGVLGRPEIGSDVMLWIVACGLVFRPAAWFFPAVGLGIVGWAGILLRFGVVSHPLHWTLGMVSAFVLAWVLRNYLVRISQAQEDLRIEDRIRQRTNEQLIEMLADAVDSLKTLRGLIPICAQCKKMRNDQGFWLQVEHYLNDHSEARFTHGLCPDCADKFRKEIR